MTKEDFLALERLLGKLHVELEHRFYLCSSTHDSYTVGIYDHKGDFIASTTTHSIEETVKQLRKKS